MEKVSFESEVELRWSYV